MNAMVCLSLGCCPCTRSLMLISYPIRDCFSSRFLVIPNAVSGSINLFLDPFLASSLPLIPQCTATYSSVTLLWFTRIRRVWMQSHIYLDLTWWFSIAFKVAWLSVKIRTNIVPPKTFTDTGFYYKILGLEYSCKLPQCNSCWGTRIKIFHQIILFYAPHIYNIIFVV